jgi:uncharacterized membrane protein YhaH (DUF805 family)
MRSILKSLLWAFVGTALFFFFLIMALVPALALLARLSGNIAQKSVVVEPTSLLRTWGLPMAAAAFVTLFALSMRHLHQADRSHLLPHV